MAEMTPMMRQYLEIKKAHPDSILFFRLGDFYEMFNDDAKLASKELDLTLTSRDHGKKAKPPEEQIPMCGIPYHASDGYIARLVAKGYKVAICEQTEDPASAKGLVKRDIIRVVTPGTVMDAAALEEKSGNFLCGLYLDTESAGAAFCDLSTGETHVTSFSGSDRLEHLINELGRFSPSEAVLNRDAMENLPLITTLRQTFQCLIEDGGRSGADRFIPEKAAERVCRQFGPEGLERLDGKTAAIQALGGLLDYLYETQKTDLSYISQLDAYEQSVFMELDLSTRMNLELTRTLRNRERRGSLLWVLDRTKTPMGGRLLKSWLEKPLLSVAAVRRRNGAVASMVDHTIPREELIAALTGFGDMERLVGRIVYGSAGGRDMVSLRSAMERLPAVREQLSQFPDRALRQLAEELDPLEDLSARIAAAIADNPPVSIREGGIIRDGYHEEVDRLRHILNGGKDIIADMEAREKEKTGIRTLKISYNKVFGYYIEVSNSFKNQVPDTYIRKQTLVNGERYITEELKELENSILTAADRVASLEYDLFMELRNELTAAAKRITQTAAAVAEADALASLAAVAVANRYCCPDVDDSGVIEIREGRHPVVERMQKDVPFVPNDVFMGEKDQRIAIITGPNMAGKSTYMRQTALIVLMAQIGSFVPAASARIGIVDRVFTRIGASDDLSAGQSTFMVEMTEVAHILRSATSRSLLILDEIGRGTSTYDGMSIARAVLEYCAEKKKAKTLFATHYHELTELEHTLSGTANYNIAVKARGDEIVFLRKILPGGADRSYGIEVAKLAGLPAPVIRRAREVLRELETEGTISAAPPPDPDSGQVSLTSVAESEVIDALRRCQPDSLTPIEAIGLLYEWKKKIT